MEIDAPLVAKKARPGQFIILRVDDEGERIPLTVAGTNPDEGTVKIIFQIVGATEKGAVNYTKIDYSVPTAIVMGAEDVGISVDILKICDSYAAIPQFGHISSLNVSVAAGILIYEAVRQRIANNN